MKSVLKNFFIFSFVFVFFVHHLSYLMSRYTLQITQTENYVKMNKKRASQKYLPKKDPVGIFGSFGSWFLVAGRRLPGSKKTATR